MEASCRVDTDAYSKVISLEASIDKRWCFHTTTGVFLILNSVVSKGHKRRIIGSYAGAQVRVSPDFNLAVHITGKIGT